MGGKGKTTPWGKKINKKRHRCADHARCVVSCHVFFIGSLCWHHTNVSVATSNGGGGCAGVGSRAPQPQILRAQGVVLYVFTSIVLYVFKYKD